MSDITALEKRSFERLFDMSSGYVVNFSNRTFEEFILDVTGRRIYDSKYDYGSGSKANRLRAFWKVEPNHTVARLTGELLEYLIVEGINDDTALLQQCRKTVERLKQDMPVADIEALSTPDAEIDFEAVGKAVREAIEKNEPETGLDRLHTYTTKFIRSLSKARGIDTADNKALHAVFGEYVKALRKAGEIESDMTERILKSSISVLESFNDVRNNQSLAHDNSLLSYDEAVLISNYVASSIRFLRSIEEHAKHKQAAATKSGEANERSQS